MTATSETAIAPAYDQLFAALAKAQGQMKNALKDSANPFFKSKYADLTSVWEACRDALSSNGISVVQFPVSESGLAGIRTILGHSSGQFLESVVWAKPVKEGPQELGSAFTYLRRYALAAAVGVTADDDDGNDAQRGADPKAGKVPPAPRANTVKSDGKKASPEAVKMLHTLRGKVGGLVVCDPKTPCPYPNGKRCGYHTQLAAFKDSDGNPVTTSKDLSPEQIANLILRYERKIQEQEMRAETPPDIGAAFNREPGSDDDVSESAKAITAALSKSQMDTEELCAIFGIDDVIQLDKEDAPKALALVLAYGTPQYGRILADVTNVPQ